MSFQINFENTYKFIKDKKYFESNFVKEKMTSFLNTIKRNDVGFFELSSSNVYLDECKKAIQPFLTRKNFIQIGIGGSSLGPEMLISALKNNNKNFIFLNNIDPEDTYDKLKDLRLEESLFYFVSKSGGTAETMSLFSIIINHFQNKGFDFEKIKESFIFATDPKESQLLQIGNEYKIPCLKIPSNIGGRFSVLTCVGFLPALFANIDCDALLKGAEELKTQILEQDLNKNILIQAASSLMSLKDQGFNQTVLMPYSSKLRDFSFWFVQLWAESLGKKQSLTKNVINEGLTPIPAYGATDQHSQVQLFMEGPFDKVFFLLEVQNFKSDFALKNSFSKSPSLEKLSPFSLSQLMKAELYGTMKALAEENRPFFHISIQNNDEKSMGASIIFFESLTAIMGHYLNLNPFDQPGVEAGKRYAFEWLKKQNSLR